MNFDRIYDITVLNAPYVFNYIAMGYLFYISGQPWWLAVATIVFIIFLFRSSNTKLIELSLKEYNAYLQIQMELAKVYDRLAKEREEDGSIVYEKPKGPLN